MVLHIDRQGGVRCLYTEVLDLSLFGALSLQRGSHVEPDAAGQWWADLSPVHGPTLGPFVRRSQALAAEGVWLEQHCLGG